MTRYGATRGSRICCGVSDLNGKSYFGFDAVQGNAKLS